MSEHRCAGEVYSRLQWGWVRCARSGSVEEDGKHWCKQHAPSAMKARAAEAQVKERAKSAARRWEYAAMAACAGVDDPQPGELAALRAEVARMKERV